jgi:DNA polymerase-3 subunit alpha
MLNGEIGTMDTKGIFQFEADGISKLLANIHVDDFEDMIVANALYRPGPLGAGVHDMYCNYKHGRKAVKYLHPKMGEVLKKTYGIMVFQENIMKVAVELAGFTGGQSDTLRKAMGKKLPEVMAKQKELFLNGCAGHDIPQKTAQKIFEQIDYFSGYGFNKSHSAAYAFLAYQTAYLKYHFPLEFMCELLTSEINNNDKNLKLNAYIRAAKKMGIACLLTDINKSGLRFKIEKAESGKEVLRCPFTILPGVGSKAVENIVANQPYDDLESFLKKTDARIVNKTVFKTLVHSGCMDDAWSIPHNHLIKEHEETKAKLDKAKKAKKKQLENMNKLGEGSLFGDEFDYSGKDLDL